ncbi:MAG: pyruvate ferredoxin oxidoreductase [Patescibacteria group bacterium]|jgi:pyruvate ferredoxin oxidoreductase alpha subunit
MSKNNQQILEGSRAIALTIKNIAPAVISAYPITPQTHIVEDLAEFKANSQTSYEYVRAESEFAAASIVLGASATGVRVYSATSSQGLLLMTEVIYNIAGLRLPVVITCANRAISSPINIWNDHSDVMSIRDAGWIQLFATDNQEAINQHILAYKLAESLKIPVMINVDGYILTHSYEPVTIPDVKLIKKYLPNYRPISGTYLNPADPVTLGAFFTPRHYMETREVLHNDLINSLKVINQEYKLLNKVLGNANHSRENKNSSLIDNGLIEYYGPKNPQTVLIALGSMVGTVREAIKDLKNVGVLKIKVYRPFPGEEIVKIIKSVKNVAVLEKAISLGSSGALYSDLSAALVAGKIKNNLNLKNYIVGLGGRDITQKMIITIVKDAPKKNNYLKFIGK